MEDKIVELRLKGYSTRQVAKLLNCARSTVSKYSRLAKIPNLAQDKSVSRLNVLKASRIATQNWQKRAKIVQQAAIAEWPEKSKNPELLAMIAMYWGEGTKRVRGKFSIINSDPGIIAAIIKALLKLGDFQYDLDINIYPDQNADECKSGWEKQLNRPINKIYIKQRRSSATRIWSKYGTCTLRVRKSLDLWLRITTWIDCWRSELGVTDSCQV